MADASATTTSDPTTTVSAGTVRAIIAPHAGYSYSGPAAAHAYFQWALNKDLIDQM